MEGEETYVEDAGNEANNIRRKLWRIESALEHIPPAAPKLSAR
jgi:hypothetical protein